MPILILIFILVVIGVVMWLVNTYIPMAANIKQILNVAVVIAVILWLLSVFFPGIANITVGRYR